MQSFWYPPQVQQIEEEPSQDRCFICNKPMDPKEYGGFRLSAWSATGEVGAKSGRLLLDQELLPNGKAFEDVCFECIPDEWMIALGYGR